MKLYSLIFSQDHNKTYSIKESTNDFYDSSSEKYKKDKEEKEKALEESKKVIINTVMPELDELKPGYNWQYNPRGDKKEIPGASLAFQYKSGNKQILFYLKHNENPVYLIIDVTCTVGGRATDKRFRSREMSLSTVAEDKLKKLAVYISEILEHTEKLLPEAVNKSVLFEQDNPYIVGFKIRTAEEFTKDESSPEEFILNEIYSKILSSILYEAKKPAGLLSVVRKATSPLPDIAGTESGEGFGLKGRAIPKDELRDYIVNISKEEPTEQERRTMPAMHQITAKNLLIPATSLAKKKAQRNQKFMEGIKEQGLEIASEAAIKNLIATLTNYSKLKILSQNAKMEKSGGEKSMYYNFSLPALRGLVYNEKDSTPENPVFLEITTCPGAGKCMLGCFARGGSFVQYNPVSERQTKILNFLYNRPIEFRQKIIDEITANIAKNKKAGIKTSIRWHDSGDFMSEGITRLYYDVMRHFEDEPLVDFYAYTKSIEMMKSHEKENAIPKNFIQNYSYGATGKGEKAIDPSKDKFSEIVPENVVIKFLERVPVIDEETGEPEIVKNKVVTKFAIKKGEKENLLNAVKNSAVYKKNDYPLITIPEYLKGDYTTPSNVVILPGEPDTPANDKTIIGIYLIEH